MEPKHSWWQIIVTILVVIIILVIVIALIIVEIRVYGTGFTGKTLWDWLQLLSAFAVPVVVGFGAVWFTARQNHDREIALQQHKNDREIAYLQHEHDHQITADNHNEAALQAYIDKMSELLLKERLRVSEPKAEVRQIARVRTITVLSKLDPIRKRTVLKFLFESELIDNNNPIVNLSYADLKEADLRRATLHNCNLEHTNLSNANLEEADLCGTNLTSTNMQSAQLSEANLENVNLSGAIVSAEQLAKAKSLKGATMPDGSIHP